MSLDSEIDANEKPKRLVQERTQVLSPNSLTLPGPKMQKSSGLSPSAMSYISYILVKWAQDAIMLGGTYSS
jgi:hypothetical protein